MEPRIEILEPKKLIGVCSDMSLAHDTTAELWKTFMPRRGDVHNRKNADYISMRVYSEHQEHLFFPTTVFTKWAAVEVLDHDDVPEGMDAYSLSGGKYAVFTHKGPASTFPKTMQYIFGEWLPESAFDLDDREHFEVLPEGYSPIDPEAEEEVWVPIQ